MAKRKVDDSQLNRVRQWLHKCDLNKIDIIDMGRSGTIAVIEPYRIRCDLLDMQRYRKAKAWYDRVSNDPKYRGKHLQYRWQRFLLWHISSVLNTMIDAKDVTISVR